jgi:ABC-type Fe3+ transport system substrate-binding protein
VPGIIAVSAGLKSAVRDWADLCAPDFPGLVGCPPKNTPLPYLAANILRRVVGERAENLLARLDTASNPIDINKRLARDELSAALLIPAFARTFRGGNGKMVWPASGAVAIPMLACLSASAPPEASEVLAYILSEEFQEAVSLGGLLAPVREGVRGFEELEANQWNMYWAGWDCLEEVGAEMLNSPPPKVA